MPSHICRRFCLTHYEQVLLKILKKSRTAITHHLLTIQNRICTKISRAAVTWFVVGPPVYPAWKRALPLAPRWSRERPQTAQPSLRVREVGGFLSEISVALHEFQVNGIRPINSFGALGNLPTTISGETSYPLPLLRGPHFYSPERFCISLTPHTAADDIDLLFNSILPLLLYLARPLSLLVLLELYSTGSPSDAGQHGGSGSPNPAAFGHDPGGHQGTLLSTLPAGMYRNTGADSPPWRLQLSRRRETRCHKSRPFWN